MKLKPHLVFNGNALEAATRYAEILGGRIENLHRYADCMPDAPEEYKDKIMHLCLVLGDEAIGMCDAEPGTNTTFGDGVITTLHCDTPEQIRAVYDALVEGGAVRYELQQTFFARQYANITDCYGVAWSLILE